MSRRPTRARRGVSARQLRVLRRLGWRFSTTREAWVHRSFNGKVGPVFREREYGHDHSAPDHKIYDAVVANRQPKVTVPPHERTPLPRRPLPLARRVSPVEVQLDETEGPRKVLVDGRPPTLGTHVTATRSSDGVVVPIGEARATA